MKKILYALGGTVRIQVRGAAVEKFLNLCTRHQIVLRRLVRIDIDELHATLSVRDFKRLRTVMGRTGCHVHLLRRRGLPFVLKPLRGRYMMLAGIGMLCAVCVALTQFLWGISLTLPEGYSSFAVMRQLRELGIHMGARISAMDLDRAKEILRQQMPEIEYITTTVQGNHIDIVFHQGRQQPELLDADAPTSVVAAKTGIITQMEVYQGFALKKTGDAVQQGEMLVSALILPNNEGGIPRLVHAAASVEARTWYEITARRADNGMYKQYTGKEKTQYALLFGDHRVNLYFGSSISSAKCDKIREESKMTLAENLVFPVRLIRQRYREYKLLPKTAAPEVQRAQMESAIAAQLARSLDGQITATHSAYRALPGGAELTLYAECQEEIAQQVLDTQPLPEPETTEGEKINDRADHAN